jgi:hypothetical protein
VLFTVRLFVTVWRVSRVRRRATRWDRGESIARALVGDQGTTRVPEVVVDDAVTVPFTAGVRRPVIVFPPAAGNWPEDDVTRALVHELEHIRRADWVVLLCSRLVCAAYWFHPLAWIAWRRLRLEIERACDDAVVRVSEASAYAEQLVALASCLTARTSVPLLSMASRSDLAWRVTSIIATAQRRTPPRPLVRIATAAAAVSLLVVIGSTQVASMPASRQQRRDPLTKLPVPDESEITHTGSGDTALVFGYLFDPSGAPLDGVELALERGRFFARSTTDRTGRYEFRKLQPGLYSFYAPTVEMVEPLTLRLTAGDEVHHDVQMTVAPLVGSFTVCADCVVRTENYELPDSLAKELEQDRREWAQKQVVTGPEPVGGWETLHPTIPEYPEWLKQKKVEGEVVIEGVIGIDGFRTNMRIVFAADPDLVKAALELLQNEQWQPARVRGVAFEVPFKQQINFVLRLPER